MPRHPNGQGKIFDDAEVSLSAFLDRSSAVREQAKVRSGYIFNSLISGTTLVAGADITDSTLNCHSVTGGTILRCALGRGVEVWDGPYMADVILAGDIKVYGDSKLIGPWSLATGYGTRIHTGVWTRPPRVHKFLRFSVTESVTGAWIGCRHNSYQTWLTRFPRIAARLKWDEAEIRELIGVFESWQLTSQKPPLDT